MKITERGQTNSSICKNLEKEICYVYLVLVLPVLHVIHVIPTSRNNHTVDKEDKSQGDSEAAG